MEISNKALLALALVFLVVSVISTGLALSQDDYRNVKEPKMYKPKLQATGNVGLNVVGDNTIRAIDYRNKKYEGVSLAGQPVTGNAVYRPPRYRR